MTLREISIENYVRQELARRRPKLVYLKFGSTSSIGMPDRLLMWDNGGILFVEFKRPGEKPRKIQTVCHELLRGMGFPVQVHDDKLIAVTEIMRYVEAHEEAVRTLGVSATSDDINSLARRHTHLLKARRGQDSPNSQGV